jgi:integrase
MKVEEGNTASFKVKGGCVRVLKLPDEVIKHFKNGLRRPFSSSNLKSTGAAISRLGEDLRKRERIRHAYTAHDYRHMYAANLFRRTRDVLAVQRGLGHASLSVTHTYLQGLGAE